MSSRKRSSSRPTYITNKHIKNSNINLFKLADPIIQSGLFIFFLFCIDSEKHFPYRTVLILIFLWQGLSCLVNFMLTSVKLLRVQRLAFFIAAIVFMAVFHFTERNVHEKFLAVNQPDQPSVPLYQLVLMTIGMILAFWYNMICYREFKSLHGSINRGNNK